MRLGIMAAVAAAALAVPADAQTYLQYRLTGSGLLTQLNGGSAAQDFMATFSVLQNGAAFTPSGLLQSDGNVFTTSMYGVSTKVDATTSGLLTFYENYAGPTQAFTYSANIQYADTDKVGGFPTSLASSSASGSVSAYSGSAYYGTGSYFSGTVYSLTVTTVADYASGFNLVLAPVPEAATWLMMMVGFGALGLTLRRERVRVSPAF